MSVGTKGPSDKTSGRQNIREDKTSMEKTSVEKTSVWVIFIRALLGKTFTDKNLLSVKEEKSASTHTLSLWEGGGKHVHIYHGLGRQNFLLIKTKGKWL
jgi:hypothetical protein